MATQASPQQATEIVKKNTLGDLQALLEKHQNQIAVALPNHMTAERMIRVALTAYSTTPGLHECSATSIAGCIVQSSILGLEPNSILGEAYLVPFSRTIKAPGQPPRRVMECQLIPGYQGLLKLARQSGEIMTVNAQPVRQKDEFEYEDGLDPFLRHRRAPGTPEQRGPIVAFWATAKLKNGGGQICVMTREEIEAHRDKYSKSWQNQKERSVWGKEFEAMALKTVLRRLCKLLPRSIEKGGDRLAAAVSLDERAESGLAQRFAVDVPLELQAPVDDDEAHDDAPESSGDEGMPKRASQVAAEAGLTDPAAQQSAARKAALEALPDLNEFPDPRNAKVGDPCKVAGRYYMFGTDKRWAEHPDAEKILAA